MILAVFLAAQMMSSAFAAERVLQADIRHRPPEMIVDGNILVGPLKDTLEEAAERLNYSIEWRAAPFFESLKGLKSGDVDIVPRTIRNPERERFIQFLGPISTQRKDILFLVRKGQEASIRDFEDIRKLTVGVKEGTAYFPAFDSDAMIAKKPSTGGDYGLAKLFIEGHVDTVAILDRGAMESALAGLGFDGHAFAQYRHVRKLENYFGMSKKSAHAEIIPALNLELKNMVATGRVKEIYANHRISPKIGTRSSIRLTPEEEQWLAQNPVLKVSNENDWPPFDFAENGEPRGYSIDFMNLLAAKIGVRFDYINGYTWPELVAMFKAGDIDVLHTLNKTPKRQEFALFTRPYVDNPPVIVTRKAEKEIKDLADLQGRKVAVTSGWSTEDLLKTAFPHIARVPVNNLREGLLAVQNGDADAFIDFWGAVTFNFRTLMMSDLKIAAQAKFNVPGADLNALYVAVGSKNQILHRILDKAIAAVTEEERAGVQEKWNIEPDAPKIALTEAEQVWLTEHKTISMGVDPAYPPFDIVDTNGRYRGMTADYIALINKRLGIEMKAVPELTWAQVEEKLRKGEIDLAPALTETSDRRRYLNFTRPYIAFPTAIVTRNDRKPAERLEDFAGKKLALVKGYFYVDHVISDYPNIEPFFVDTPLEAIKAVSFGKADGLIENLAVVSYLIDEQNVTNLRLDAEADIQSKGLAIGVRQDWPMFVSILNKALDSITQNEHRAIRNKWISTTTKDSSPAEKLTLTQQEMDWLRDHPEVTVANELDWPPFDFAENGKPKGMTIDLIRRAAENAGISLKFINGYTWTELVDKFKSKEIHVLPAVYFTPERQEFMSFTSSYATNPSVLVVHSEHTAVSDMADLKGLKVAVISGFVTAEIMKSRFPDVVQVPVNNVQEGLKAVSLQHADAFVGSIGVISHIMESTVLPNIRIVGEVWLQKREETELHMAVLKENAVLRDILQKGLDSISKDELRELRRNWVPFGSMDEADKVKLTAEERDWLRTHKKIRLGDDFVWPPFTFLDDSDRFAGIAAGYTETISKRTGIDFEPMMGLTWKKVLDKIKAGDIDVLPAVARTKDREKFLHFTKPYISFPIVIATRKDGTFVDSLGDLSGMKVGVVEGYVTQEILAKDHPKLVLVTSENLTEGLRNLRDRKIDAFVDNLGSITYEMDKQKFEEIKIAAPTDYRFELSFGVRKDWPLLAQILDKALETIDDKERAAIKNTWMAIQVKFGLDLKTILIWAAPIGSSALLIIAVIVVWNRKLGREIEDRKKAQAELSIAHDELGGAMTHIEGSINYASRIQRSILPDDSILSAVTQDHFVLWKPRDVVGGDIYWHGAWGEGCLIILGDCTGHGVPGAFMTLITVGDLERAMSEIEGGNLGALVARLHQYIQVTLSQHYGEGESNDGIELGACYFVPEEPRMTFVGARFELFINDGDDISIIKGTKMGMGYRGIPYEQAYDENVIDLKPGQSFYLTSDGLIDQIGGKRKRMFGKKRFKEVLTSVQNKSMAEQKETIYQALLDYQGEENRRDDVSVIGFKF